jgi:tetratricopeptide (TPR) repeat protein
MTPPPRPAGALDAALALLVAALAFLLACTPARNSDVWLHLASGRLLAQGQFPGGTDPFSSTTADVRWVNHGWLADGLFHLLFTLGGGKALVLARAGLAAALAGLFFCFRPRGARAGSTALAAAVSVVALGPWLRLQSDLLSLLGVALTLYLLERPGWRAADAPGWADRRWLLLPLFALWANLDGWFFLGPVLVGLYALGAAPSGWRAFRGLALLALLGLAACLLNPFGYRVLGWPASLGLSHAEQVLMGDPAGGGLVVSPFAPRFLASPLAACPGVWAYYLLLAAGPASFVLCGRAAHPGRLLAWAALAGLSLYQARAVGFFAVAAGALTALNLRQWAATAGVSAAHIEAENAGRRVAVFVGLLLLVLAYPGWLQPTPYQPRGWAVEPDDSLVRLARRLTAWHAGHALRPDRFAFTLSAEAANHLAWFCPAERGFLDARLPLFGRVAGDFVRVRQLLLQPPAPGEAAELTRLLDAHRIDRVLVHDPDGGRTAQTYRRLLSDGQEWDLLALEGGAALFGRRSQRGSPPQPPPPLDLRAAAYHPTSQPPLPAPPPLAPPGLLDPFVRTPLGRSADREEAALHLTAFDLAASRTREELSRHWLLALASGMVTSPAPCQAVPATAALALRFVLTPAGPAGAQGRQPAEAFAGGFLAARDQGPPESLLLAVRAARRALADRPDDGGAALLLGEAYVRMARQTRERAWHAALPSLGILRKAQALTALQRAVAVRPDLDQAHALLAQLYLEAGQLDRVLDHLRARVRIAGREAAPPGGAAERLRRLEADAAKMADLVEQSEKIYAANSAPMGDPSQVLLRANLALRYGLARKALEMLQALDPVVFGKAGVRRQLDLMMLAGQAAAVRAAVRPNPEEVLGFSQHHWLLAEAAACCGDYADADAELEQLSEELRRVRVYPERPVALPVRSVLALRAAEAALTRPAPRAGPAGLAGAAFLQVRALAPLGALARLLRQEADFRVLRGLLALEAGDASGARRHLRAAVSLWGPTPGGLDFPARVIAQDVLRLLEP